MPLDSRPYRTARRDFSEALAIVQHLQGRGYGLDRIESIGHMMISIAHTERRAEFRVPNQSGENQGEKVHVHNQS